MKKHTEDLNKFIKTATEIGPWGVLSKSWKLLIRRTFMNLHKIKGKLSDNVINKPYQIVNIPVDLIKKECVSSKLEESKYFKVLSAEVYTNGIVLDGAWDLQIKDIEHNNVLIAFKQRFEEGKKWENTKYYKIFEDRMNREGKHGVGFARSETKSWEEFKERFLIKWDKLYENIKKEGYCTNREKNKRTFDEILVCISRKGEIMRICGRGGVHRFAIVKLLGIKKIPVIVNTWHQKYIEQIEKNKRTRKLTPEIAIKQTLKKD